MFNFLYNQQNKRNVRSLTQGFTPFKLQNEELPGVYDMDISEIEANDTLKDATGTAAETSNEGGIFSKESPKMGKLANAISVGGSILGSLGPEDQYYADGTNATSGLDRGTHEGLEAVKDTVASTLGPWGQAFRGVQKGGKALGKVIAGEEGGDFAQGFLNPVSNFMRADFSVLEKGISAFNPIVGGILSMKKNKERRAEAMEDFQDTKFDIAKLQRGIDYKLQQGDQVSPAEIGEIKEKMKHFNENKNTYYGQ